MRWTALAASLVLAGCPAGNDDDSSRVADDDDVAGCTVNASGGSGGASGLSWITVPGWSTDDGANTPDYEVVVYRPPTVQGSAPLAILTSNPVSADRSSIENIVVGSDDGGFDAWAETYGYIVAFPVGGGVEGGLLAFRSQQDEPYMGAAIDAIGQSFDVDLNSVHLFGRSGGAYLAIQLAQAQATRVASIMSLAGPQPFPNWESGEPAWDRPVGALLIHDENDPIVSRPTVLDTAVMFESLGGEVERFFDYTGMHEWVPEQVEPRMALFFDRTCL